MKRMASENDKTGHGIWNESERSIENQNQGLKSVKRHKSPGKSFIWADELKRQLTYTLKPSKCSNTEVPKKAPATHTEEHHTRGTQQNGYQLERIKGQQRKKFFSDLNIESILMNSEYFKLKSGKASSMSFCSGEKGENRWTIDTKTHAKGPLLASDKTKGSSTLVTEDTSKMKKSTSLKKTEAHTEADELKNLKENLETLIREMKSFNRDFSLVRMDLKTIEKLIGVQKQAPGQTKTGKNDGNQGESGDEMNSKLGRFSEDVEKAAQELKDFIDNNRTFLIGNDEIPKYPDFDKIINNLHRLSEAAYQPKIIQTSKGAKFEIPRELPISLYSDGMLLRNKDFRKYTDIRASLFLRDIEDGFFPGELWSEYPYDVPFQVTDRRCEIFNDGRFPGSGRRLGSNFDGKPAAMVYLEPTKPEKTLVEIGCGEPERRRPSTYSSQEHHPKSSSRAKSASHHVPKPPVEERNEEVELDGKMLSLKVRLGNECSLQVNMLSNAKMSKFQDLLYRKLCERYHDQYIKNMINTDNNKYDETVPDFEIHVYGRKPFRLSENLNLYPFECGIVDNCVINIMEI